MNTLFLGLCALAVAWGADKVQPWLLNHAQGKESLEFFVVLKARADLFKADTLNSKLEKGYFVRDALRATAQESQASLQQFLRDQNVSFQSFFIVNALLVTGSPKLMHILVARNDVLRVEGNPMVKLQAPLNVSTVFDATPDAIEPGLTFIGAPNVWGQGFEVF